MSDGLADSNPSNRLSGETGNRPGTDRYACRSGNAFGPVSPDGLAESHPSKRRSSDQVARDTLDAIRLAVEGAGDDHAAVAVIRALLADSTPAQRDGTASVRRLLRAIKRTRRARSRWA